MLPSLLVNGTLSSQKKTVKAEFSKSFNGKVAKDVQTDGIVSLVNGLNTFVLAATGVGKSSIAIGFLKLFTPAMLPVMIVINPLDALGDNQVSSIRCKINQNSSRLLKFFSGCNNYLGTSPSTRHHRNQSHQGDCFKSRCMDKS
jgi:hypothetical protein